MNRNKTKKICIDFGLTPRQVIDHELFRESQLARISFVEGNCTWREHPKYKNGFQTYAQIVFASADEWKVMRVMNKYGGKIIDPDLDLNQYQIEETDQTNTGMKHQIELATEIFKGNNFDYNIRR